jgi:RNA polymerase sigma-70 factor (ECF subfamily)
MGEREAIDRLKGGDIDGLEELVRRYQVRAMRAAYLVTHDPQLAEDVVQTAFVQAYERIRQFDSARPFGPWFLRSLVNAAVKAAVRAERSVSLDGEPEGRWEALIGSDPNAEPEVALDRAEARRAVRDALARLSPNQRAAIVLRYYLELSEADMAQRLAIPRGTVKRRLHDARERLRVMLGREVLPHSRSRQED